MSSVSYFLGANTPAGFYSLFNELYCAEDDCKVYIIKGGPGTGKSSLIKSIASEAEKRGFNTEQIYCSSDPLSLDALIIPDLKVSVADGTSPHTLEPVYPGVCETIINLGECWNTEKLTHNKNEIINITKQNSVWHKKCVKFLSAASVIDKEILYTGNQIFNKEKTDRYTTRLCNQNLTGISSDTFTVKRRFLNAITPDGISTMKDTILNICETIININDNMLTVKNSILNSIYNFCMIKKINIIVCMCPMNPDNKIDHIILPDLKIGFVSSNRYHSFRDIATQNINCRKFYNNEYNTVKNKVAFFNKAKSELISEAVKCLKNAKTAHDVLENYYITAMDYNKVSLIKEKLITNIFNVSRETL